MLWEQGAPHPELHPATIAAALEAFLAELGCAGAGVSVLMAGDETLHVLNHRHRGLDRPTDVLSWCYAEPAAAPDGAGGGGQMPPPGGELLGEIALSLDRAAAQAADNGWDLATEVLRLLAHACAHLVGYDHQEAAGEREMKAVEIRLLRRVGLTDIYPEG